MVCTGLPEGNTMVRTQRTVLVLDGGEVDWERRTLIRPTGSVRLTPIEARLLAHLAAAPGRTVSRDDLLVQVWDSRPGVRSRTVFSTVERLRRKIELEPSRPRHVVTDGSGYRFVPVAPNPSPGRSAPAAQVRAAA